MLLYVSHISSIISFLYNLPVRALFCVGKYICFALFTIRQTSCAFSVCNMSCVYDDAMLHLYTACTLRGLLNVLSQLSSSYFCFSSLFRHCLKQFTKFWRPCGGLPLSWAHAEVVRARIGARRINRRTLYERRYSACLRGQRRSHPKGAGPQHSQFWGFLCIYVYTLCCRTTKSDVVKHMDRALSCGQPRLPSQDSRVPGLPNFWGSPVFMPTPVVAELPNLTW